MPASAGDSSTTGSAWHRSAPPDSRPRRSRRRCIRAVIRARRQGPELEQALLAFGAEDAVEEQSVEMDVQIQSAAEALDDGHASRPPVTDPGSARAVALEAQQPTHEHAEHRARQRVIPREEIAKTVRQTQHPLAHGHARQHLVDKTGGALRHAPPAATRAETPALAGKRHEPLHRAGGASQAREAVRQHPQVRKSLNSCSTNSGSEEPSA